MSGFPKGILKITSTGGTITVTNPNGPIVNLESGGGSGAVSSVFSRTGAVVAASGDYTVGQVTGAAPSNNPTFTGSVVVPEPADLDNSGLAATTSWVTRAIGEIPAAPVVSVFTRTGAVVATTGDYAVAQITGAAPLASPTFTGTVNAAAVTTSGLVTAASLKIGTSSTITNAGTTVSFAGGASFGGIVTLTQGSSTQLFATITTQAVTSGVAFQPGANDFELVIPVTLAGTITMTMGPTTGSENTVLSSFAVVAGTVITKRIPRNWMVVITLVTATLATVTKQGC